MPLQLSLLDLLDAPTPMPSAPAPQTFQFGPELSSQQLRVRERGAGNQVVVAGAGTGKTETLIQRILKLLIEGDGQSGPRELSQVLALTFTDKGAAEMRGRVYNRIVQIGRELPRGPLQSRLLSLRSDFAEHHRITTFDAFSARILGQFPHYSPLAGEAQPLDGATRAAMNREVARQFWNRTEATFSEAQKMELWELLDAFSSRRAALGAIAMLAEEESEEDLRALSLLPPREKWSEEFAVLVAQGGQKLWEEVEAGVEKLEIPVAMRAEILDGERILMGGKGGIFTDKGWSAAFIKRWSPELVPGLNRVEKRLLAWRAEARHERDEDLDWKSRRAVAFASDYALWWQGACREWWRARGVASFAEIARAALEMVGVPEIAGALRASFSHVLIDEFQDTNRKQWALLDALRNRETGNVLVVGDEKQAIFRFRGGDITVFDAVRAELIGQQSADELTLSRRSTRQLVGWTNTVFREVLPSNESRQAYEAPFQALDSLTQSENNGLWQLQPARWHFEAENDALGGQVPPMAMQRERAGRGLARWLRALCDDAGLWNYAELTRAKSHDLASNETGFHEANPLASAAHDAQSQSPNLRETAPQEEASEALDALDALSLRAEPRRLKTPDLQFPEFAAISRQIARGETAVGIIFTSHAVKTTFEGQLRAYDVPFVSVRGSGFWLSEAATLTLHLLQILLDGSDRVALVGLARSALGGLSDVALLEWHLALEADKAGETDEALQADEAGETDNADNADNADEAGEAGDFCAHIEGFAPSREDDARAWAVFAARLRNWRELARVAPVSEVLEAVLDESELAFYHAGMPDGAQREANWRKIVELVREREADGQGGLRSLVDDFSALVEEAQGSDREAEAPLPGEASIQLMTVWAAKGLGFPLTILAQLDDAPRAPGGLVARGNLDGARQIALGISDDAEDDKAPKPWVWEKLRAADIAEEEAQWRRLFYVACTRAETHLMLVQPEREVRAAAAWINLCQPGARELTEILPALGIPREKTLASNGPSLPPPAPSPPIPRAAPREVALGEVAGVAAERFGARARSWVENRLSQLGGTPETVRQDVPFSSPARLMGLQEGDWLVGAWEWIAPLPDGAVLLVASGMDGEIAARRAALMRLAAENAGLQVRECWAVWALGEQTEGKLI